ncbi:MAG: lipopolysaccharide assembly protein LapA domain-containing protein [Sporichthyaceae bacterium]
MLGRPADPEIDPRTERKIRRAQTVKVVVALLVCAAVVGLAVDNRDRTTIGWLVGSMEAPLYVVLLLCFLAGALAGGLLTHFKRQK